ncbi:hypothetical protein GN958_ATG07196 [Phytophthora infestans]|uniref:Uncharacterized protein n=1 Tax=Phytophthora infestans TaxID=4787 RepID=A0A8S9USM5_PHYIN|nr:hypothetical protein GN958_ATG07196 [Phytophthora infestans]
MRVLLGEDKSLVGNNLHGIGPLGSTSEPLQISRGGSKIQSLRKQGRVQRALRTVHKSPSPIHQNRMSTFSRILNRTRYRGIYRNRPSVQNKTLNRRMFRI